MHEVSHCADLLIPKTFPVGEKFSRLLWQCFNLSVGV